MVFSLGMIAASTIRMRVHTLTLSLLGITLLGGACAADTDVVPVLVGDDAIDLSAHFGADDVLRGVTRDPNTGLLQVLAEGRGILTLNDDGTTSMIETGTRGLLDLPYRDIASLGDDRYLLIADNEGYLYDALTEQHRVHFCVEPGFIDCFDENGELIDENNNGICDWEEEQVEPQPVVQHNDALTLVGNEVVAAPRFYESGTRVEASLRSYNAATGVPTGAVDLSSLELDLTGLTPHAGVLVGVAGDRVVRFGLDGARIDEAALDGVSDAAGVISDGDGIYVLDADVRALVRFALVE
jgi:hypothetical protein